MLLYIVMGHRMTPRMVSVMKVAIGTRVMMRRDEILMWMRVIVHWSVSMLRRLVGIPMMMPHVSVSGVHMMGNLVKVGCVSRIYEMVWVRASSV